MDRKFAALVAAIIDRIRVFPPEALDELFSTLDDIERKYDLMIPLTDEEKEAIEESLRSVDQGAGIPVEKVLGRFVLGKISRDADGREAFVDAAMRVQKLPGESQGAVADVIYALLDESPLDDVPPDRHA